MRSPLQQALDRIGSAPAVWTPATLFAASEQGVWYDPSDFSTLFQDAAGTVPVTATGQEVGKILDKSGRGNHATQATTASKPILQQDGNGKYYLAFDGMDDSMVTAAVDFTATDKITSVFGLFQQNTGVGFLYSGGSTDSLGIASTEITVRDFAATDFVGRTGNTTKTQVKFTGVSSAAFVGAVSFDLAQSTALTEQIGRSNGSAAPATVVIAGPDSGFFKSAPIRIGNRTTSLFNLNGRIYQLIIRGALTDAAGITAAETFVNTKTAAY